MHENNEATSYSQEINNEASLLDVIKFLRASWRWLLGFAITGAVCTLLLSIFFMNPLYEASASMQMARVANDPVETPQFLIEKMKLPMFYSKSAISECGVEGASEPGFVLASALVLAVNKAGPIVQLKFQGSTPERASNCLLAVSDDIRMKQQELAAPLINQIKIQITHSEQQLSELIKVKILYENALIKSTSGNVPLSVSNLILSASLSQFKDIETLRSKVDFLKNSLEPPETQEARLIYSVYAPNKKVSPSHFSWGVAGAIGGIVLGFFVALARNALRRMRL